MTDTRPEDAGASGATAAPALLIEGLAKRYGPRRVLAGVDLAVAAGDAFGLLGLNGAGKTTLIKCVLDLAGYDAGRIALYGVDARRAVARARLAYLPERFMPPHYLRCREFLAMMCALAGAQLQGERLRVLLDELELGLEVLERPVRELSKGMTQKLGLAACLVLERDLYLLDEPMSGLDPASRVAVKSALLRISNEGRTLFFTSHVLADVEELCRSIAVLDRGSLRFRGTPEELCTRFGERRLERAFLQCIRSGIERDAQRA